MNECLDKADVRIDLLDTCLLNLITYQSMLASMLGMKGKHIRQHYVISLNSTPRCFRETHNWDTSLISLNFRCNCIPLMDTACICYFIFISPRLDRYKIERYHFIAG